MGTAELVIGAQTEPQLLDGLCRLLVASQLFAQAWIGRPNSDGDLEIESICNLGGEPNAVSKLPNIITGDEINDLTVRAWRLRQLQFTNNRRTNLEGALIPLSDRSGPPSAAAVVPLYRSNEIWALLTLQSCEPDIFSPELLELMERIGRLAGHGLDGLDLRQTLEKERTYQAWLARRDALTDLLNRRGLTERVEEAIARSRQQNRPMAVAFMSLNGFQALNELHGRPICDRLLRTVADRVRAGLKEGDAAARLDGDDFVLVLEALEEGDPGPTLSRIQASVEGPLDLFNGIKTTIRTSLGVTLFPRDNSPAQHLLRHADRALCTFKEARGAAGSRWMVYQPEVDAQRRIHQKHVLSLFRNGNVEVHYQPIIDLQTGGAFKVEALARLADDNRLLLPADFVPHFGHAELTALTFLVLSRGIQDMHRLDDAGFRMNLGINLEPTTLADPQATQKLCRQIETSGLGTNRIVLELLEHPDTLSLTGSREVLLDLKRSGAKVALDDVGSAYSSLLRIKELPVDTIKLDRSFMSGLDRQPQELRFMMHLVELAQTLGVDLIAEGIESNACRDALAALGIRFVQGYAIAKPMNICQLEVWLQEYKAEPWIGPTTALGAVALQLRDLFILGRILDQKPSLLQRTSTFEAQCACPIGHAFRAVGRDAVNLLSAHMEWHRTMADLWKRSTGQIGSAAFQTARVAYEEQMFRLVLEAQAEECESVQCL
jgi:diguanylate cyclase (GGDEF)-like protein